MKHSRRPRHRRVTYGASKKAKADGAVGAVAAPVVAAGAAIGGAAQGITDGLGGRKEPPETHYSRWFVVVLIVVLSIAVAIYASGGGATNPNNAQSQRPDTSRPDTRSASRVETNPSTSMPTSNAASVDAMQTATIIMYMMSVILGIQGLWTLYLIVNLAGSPARGYKRLGSRASMSSSRRASITSVGPGADVSLTRSRAESMWSIDV